VAGDQSIDHGGPSPVLTIGFLGSRRLLRQLEESFVGTPAIRFSTLPEHASIASWLQAERPDAIVCDLALFERAADAWRDARELNPGLDVTVFSSHPDHRSIREGFRLGARQFFLVPDEWDDLVASLRAGIADALARRKREEFLQYQQSRYDFSRIIGHAPRLRETLRRARKLIESKANTILILGETGTGKELLARALHYNGPKRDAPFVEINCSAIPESLLESELFGYEKGAFTDARERKRGLFEFAEDGTIFLDEIGDMPLSLQAKLLRVLEERRMRPLGAVHDVAVRARIFAATSQDLERLVASGAFRRDLFHRLNILPLILPPLRERRDDILPLVHHYIAVFQDQYGKAIQGITLEARDRLLAHAWEGNVRELQHSVERAIMLCEGRQLDVGDFDLNAFQTRAPSEETPGPAAEAAPAGTIRIDVALESASADAVERMLVLKVLELTGNNKSRAAQILKISRPRLDRILAGR
jgi:DNA-binding NtrC family response regulator